MRVFDDQRYRTIRFRICSASWKFAVAIAFTSLCTGCTKQIVVSEAIPPAASNPASNGEERLDAVYSLPMTVITVSGAFDATAKTTTYAITPSILPDNSARYRLRYVPTDFADNSVTLGVDQNGLLSSITANATGHEGDIIVALATTAASAATVGGTGLPPAARIAPTIAASCTKKLPFTVVYELRAFTAGSQPLPDCSTISVSPTTLSATLSSAAAGSTPAPCAFSVCYRDLMTVTATITDQDQLQEKQAKFIAIDPNSLEGLNLKSAPFVQRTHSITFNSGLMTSAAISDPSVALAVANLPLTVVKAILSAPAALLTIKTTNVQDETSLLTQQAALINAQLALQKAVANLKPQSAVAGTGSSP